MALWLRGSLATWLRVSLAACLHIKFCSTLIMAAWLHGRRKYIKFFEKITAQPRGHAATIEVDRNFILHFFQLFWVASGSSGE